MEFGDVGSTEFSFGQSEAEPNTACQLFISGKGKVSVFGNNPTSVTIKITLKLKCVCEPENLDEDEVGGQGVKIRPGGCKKGMGGTTTSFSYSRRIWQSGNCTLAEKWHDPDYPPSSGAIDCNGMKLVEIEETMSFEDFITTDTLMWEGDSGSGQRCVQKEEGPVGSLWDDMMACGMVPTATLSDDFTLMCFMPGAMAECLADIFDCDPTRDREDSETLIQLWLDEQTGGDGRGAYDERFSGFCS